MLMNLKKTETLSTENRILSRIMEYQEKKKKAFSKTLSLFFRINYIDFYFFFL